MKKCFRLIIFLLFSSASFDQDEDSAWFVNNYTKLEQYIPMRDGIKLFTSIYIPKDQKSKHPFLMTRTPYSCAPYGTDKFMAVWRSYKMAYAKENFIFVTQGVRGRYMIAIHKSLLTFTKRTTAIFKKQTCAFIMMLNIHQKLFYLF
jgi:hypothetical protein